MSPSTGHAQALIHGVLDGSVLNGDTSLGSYASGSDSLDYSEIDTEATASALSDLSLDIYMSFLDFDNGVNETAWDKMIAMAEDRDAYTGSLAWPQHLVVGMQEPVLSGSTDLEVWDDEYVGGGLGFTGYDILDTLYNEFDDGALVPDAISLDEICNWSQVAHRPYDADVVESDDIRDLIETIQAPAGSSGLDREAWGYMSESATLDVALQAWVIGTDPAHTSTAHTGVAFTDTDYVGFEVPMLCFEGGTTEATVLHGVDDPASNYYELLLGVGVSFLQHDLASDDEQWDDEHLYLTTFVAPPSAASYEVWMADSLHYVPPSAPVPVLPGANQPKNTESFPFQSIHPESVELLQEGNLYQPDLGFFCEPPGSLTAQANTFSVLAECGAADGICSADKTKAFAYIADLKMDYHTLNNCGLTDAVTIGGGASASPFTTSTLPAGVTAADLPVTTGGDTYIGITTFFPTVTLSGTAPLYLKFGEIGDGADLLHLHSQLDTDPALAGMTFCAETYTQETDLDTEAVVTQSQPEFLSTSNEDERFLDKEPTASGLLEGLVVRYAFGSTVDEYDYFDAQAQQRLMAAVQEAVELAGGSYGLAYLETNTWVFEYDHDWIVDFLDNILVASSGLIGGKYSLSWWESQLYATDYGEFVQRTELIESDDKRLTITDSDDDFDVRFHYPNDRKGETVPGWYQLFEGTVTVPAFGELSFEWDVGVCSTCGSSIDTIVEVQIQNVATSVDEPPEIWVVNQSYDVSTGAGTDSILTSSVTVPAVSFLKTSGTYNIKVYMYTVDTVDARRHVYFRMTNPLDLTSNGVAKTVHPGGIGWDYTSGILTSTAGTYPVNYLPTDYSSAYFDEAWDQSAYLFNCLGYYYIGDTDWEDSCL